MVLFLYNFCYCTKFNVYQSAQFSPIKICCVWTFPVLFTLTKTHEKVFYCESVSIVRAFSFSVSLVVSPSLCISIGLSLCVCISSGPSLSLYIYIYLVIFHVSTVVIYILHAPQLNYHARHITIHTQYWSVYRLMASLPGLWEFRMSDIYPMNISERSQFSWHNPMTQPQYTTQWHNFITQPQYTTSWHNPRTQPYKTTPGHNPRTQPHDTTPWHNLIRQPRDTTSWHNPMTQPHDTTPWHNLMTQLHDTTPWHNLMRQPQDTTPEHNLMTQTHDTTSWRNNRTQPHDTTPWHNPMTQPHNATPGHSLMVNFRRTRLIFQLMFILLKQPHNISISKPDNACCFGCNWNSILYGYIHIKFHIIFYWSIYLMDIHCYNYNCT